MYSVPVSRILFHRPKNRSALGLKTLRAVIEKDAKTLLDVGVGPGLHAAMFLAAGLEVTGLGPHAAEISHPRYSHAQCMLEDFRPKEPFDIVWACHVLEHAINPGSFLTKCRELTNPGGWLAITVPAEQIEFTGIHSCHTFNWTPARLLYMLVLAGWDCKQAQYYTTTNSPYVPKTLIGTGNVALTGYHLGEIGLIVPRVDAKLPKLTMDVGQVDRLQEFYPVPLKQRTTHWLPDRWSI